MDTFGLQLVIVVQRVQTTESKEYEQLRLDGSHFEQGCFPVVHRGTRSWEKKDSKDGTKGDSKHRNHSIQRQGKLL